MVPQLRWDWRNLPTRLILSFVAVIVATMGVVSVPALRLIEGELERQAAARVAQAASATEALYAARGRELQTLATLSAERPTLRRLLAEGDRAALPPYLEAIRATTGVDFLAVADASGAWVAQVPTALAGAELLPAPLDPAEAGTSLRAVTVGGAPALALVAQAPVRADGATLGATVEMVLLDDSFLAELGRETGLHHALFLDGARLATTLPALPGRLERVTASPLQVAGEPFYLQQLALPGASAGVVDVLALPGREIVATRQRVLQVLGGSTLLVTLLATVLGSALARHVTAPLNQLVAASEGIGRGDLRTPIASNDGIAEVATLARTLEQMRERLQNAYDDLQRSKAWSDNLIASLSEGVLTVDAAGRLTSFSPGAERILGWRAVDVIGRPLEAVFQPTAIGPRPAEPLPTAPGRVTRQTVLSRSGEPVALLVTSGAATLRAAGQPERAFVVRDVTEEERAQRQREFLLANVSHEFKTPLSALHAAVELLASELPTLTEGELRELVNSVWQGTLRLEELVDNLLSSASLQAGHFSVRPRPTDLEAVIEEVLLATRPLLVPKGQWLKVDAPSPLPPARADARRLSQVLVNLISNASKYGPAAAPIVLRVVEEPDCLRVEVHDSGPGVAPEVQPRLFQPFSRNDDADRSGIGLGLSIVRAIVERHGGAVGAHSAPGQGATFWFTLPLAR